MWHDIVSFLNSSFLSSIVALFVGSFAYGIYLKRQRDAKQRAALVILLEIQGAEQQLTKVSVDKPFPEVDVEQVRLMPVQSWEDYKHLFTNDFDRNENDKISDFYTRCAAYDQAAELNSNIVFERSQQELRINAQRILADYAREYNDLVEKAPKSQLPKLEQAYITRRQQFIEIYANTSPTHMFTYAPIKPYNDAVRALQGLEPSLSLTSVGTKLKVMSKPQNFFGKRKK
jgi:hypothetical protein